MEYLTPSELLKIKEVKERFENYRNIGYFVSIFKDKIPHYRTAKSIKICKNSFLQITDLLNDFKIS